jgi:hypothetical protein
MGLPDPLKTGMITLSLTAFTLHSTIMIFKIPFNSVPAKLKKEIEESLPQPLEVAGWKFNGYVWRLLNQINTKNKEGNTDNSVRLGGTGTNDVLLTSLKKGLDITKLTPSIFPDDNLLNGFNRHKNLQLLGYQEWIFAEYQIDESTKTEFQVNEEEYIDDFRAAANGGDGAKVITKEELIELGRKRFEPRSDRGKKAVARWIHSLDLNLSKDQVNGIAQTVSKDFARRGVIESYTRQEAESKVAKLGLGCAVLNTKDSTRALRMFPQIMANYIKNGTIFKIVDFHSDATTHKQIDDGRVESQQEILDFHYLCLDYAAEVCKNRGELSWERIGGLVQKIGAEKAGPLGIVQP